MEIKAQPMRRLASRPRARARVVRIGDPRSRHGRFRRLLLLENKGQSMITKRFRKVGGAAVAAFVLFAFACASAFAADSRATLDRDATTALSTLKKRFPAAVALEKDAKAVLIFPAITKAGFGVGAETGQGVLRVGGRTVGYYNTSGVSYGLQAGIQRYGYAMFFMTDAALKSLDNTGGFEIGVGPSVVVMDDALAKKMTSATIQSDIYAFVFANQGLMAGLGIQGNKITRLP
jgi:lipid-binding SYLF domain-containing protein